MTDVTFHNEIIQLRAQAFVLNMQRYALRQKMEEAGLSGFAIRRAIGFSRIEIRYASEYEQELYQVWYLLIQKRGYEMHSVYEVDEALMRSGVPSATLRSEIEHDKDTMLTRRFFKELTGITLPSDSE